MLYRVLSVLNIFIQFAENFQRDGGMAAGAGTDAAFEDGEILDQSRIN